MSWLVSLPPGAIFPLFVFLTAIFGFSLSLHLHRRFTGKSAKSMGDTAAAYSTVLGSLFAILTGFLINAAFNTVNTSKQIVVQEAAAANRIAWVARDLGGEGGERLQDDLQAYLRGVVDREWERLGDTEYDNTVLESTRGNSAMQQLELLQRDSSVVVTSLDGSSAASEVRAEALYSAVNDLQTQRRLRFDSAQSTTPLGMFLLALVAGISLIANSIVVTLRGRVWDAFVAAGITLIVGLDLALIVNLSAPFSGGFTVPSGPLTEIYEALRQGVYR
ncbi:MAG: hypothetical protein ACKOBH_04450 [bacterium]